MPTTTRPKAREPSSGVEIGLAASSSDYGGQDRAEALLIYRSQLWIYVRTRGLGETFQAIDFSAWLATRELRPDPSKIDPRATGGLFLDLVRVGICEKIGYKSNGGDKARNYNACPRQTYRIIHLDHSLLGWETHPAFYPRSNRDREEAEEAATPADDAPTPIDAKDPDFEDPNQLGFGF
jgi:hypothetical protein